MVDSDDESLTISCSSPCLPTAVIASRFWEIIAFLSAFPNSSLSFPHFLLSLILCCLLFFLSPSPPDNISQLCSLPSGVKANTWPSCQTVQGFFVFPLSASRYLMEIFFGIVTCLSDSLSLCFSLMFCRLKCSIFIDLLVRCYWLSLLRKKTLSCTVFINKTNIYGINRVDLQILHN